MRHKLIGANEQSLSNIFKNRGVGVTDILGVTETSLIDPFALKNMDKAVELVHKHLEKDSLIIIQQDPDADGYTSTALLYQYLKLIKPSVELLVLIHEGKAHGINEKAIDELLESGLNPEKALIISPDASSNEHELHASLASKGLDVLILDHHEAYGYSPTAVMINPSLDEYPNKNISGVGVTQKFAKAYDMTYGFDFAENFYDLVAVGMIADMMELTTPETVFMVQKGMREHTNSFLKALYEKQSYSLKGAITPTGISFYIAPLINAVTRTATFEEKQLITRAMVSQEEVNVKSTKRGAKAGDLEDLHEQAVRIMANIKSRQGREVDKAMAIVEEKIEEGNLADHKILIVDVENKFKKDFTGLIANKLMSDYQMPVLLGNPDKTDKLLQGSGRTYDKSELADLRGFLNESGLVEYAEGHAAAHGFGIKKEQIPSLLDYANEKLKDIDFLPTYRIDFSATYGDGNTIDFLNQLTTMASFWGRGMDEPYFLIEDMPVSSSEVEVTGDFGSRSVKIVKPGFTALKFKLSDEKVSPFISNQQNVISFIARAQMSEFRGQRNLTLFMEDFEYKRQQKFYF